MGLTPGSAQANPTIITLSSSQGILGSFVLIYGTGFGDAQGQSYVLFGGHVVIPRDRFLANLGRIVGLDLYVVARK